MQESKTPKFDELIEKILDELVPHERTCLECKNDFKVEYRDIELLKIFRVPPPTLCPDCRHRRRLSFSNYSNIYKRKCSVPGHTDIMISPVAPVMPWITYDYDTYYSDLWNPFSYGKKIDSSPFFEQFFSLLKVVPQPGVRKGANSLNSDFCFYGESLKDGYYVFGGRRSENVLYSSSIYDSKNVVDSYFLRDVDTAYDNIGTADCYNCKHAYFSSNCMDCSFIYDCKNCQYCFGCVNLRNKKYCWYNEQLTKDEYETKINSENLGSIKKNKEIENIFWKFAKSNPLRATRISQSENVLGNDVKRSKNCQDVFQIEDSENVRHASFVIFRIKDSMDTGFSGRAERSYEAQNVSANSSNVKFSFSAKGSSDSEFLITCSNCHDCFGCIGLKNASYCILNKQYEPEDYFKKIDEIKTKMLRDGQYGEFFPMSFSPLAYNSTLANIVFPMTEEDAKEKGLYWQQEIETDTKGLKTIQSVEIEDNIKNVDYGICDLVIIGEISKKPFRIIKREVDFYKQHCIPLPTDAPHIRMLERFKILNNFKVFNDNCFSCKKDIESAYKTSEGYKPYCEDCYKREIL